MPLLAKGRGILMIARRKRNETMQTRCGIFMRGVDERKGMAKKKEGMDLLEVW